jgi:hypothetical protein
MIIFHNYFRKRNVPDKSRRENQNTVLHSIIFFYENRAVYEIKLEKYSKPRQAIDDNIVRRMCITFSITMATDTHSEYIILIAFHGNNGYAKVPQCYFYKYIS